MKRRRTDGIAVALVLAAGLLLGCGDDGAEDAGRADMAGATDADTPPDAPIGVDLGPIDCETPGETQTVPCGLCGTRDRVCGADGEWELTTECAGEGVCVAGTTREEACGSCGTRTLRCTDACVWDESAVCMGEGGDCVPGERRVTGNGCGTGEYREVTCNASCTEEETLGCGSKPETDVVWLVYLRSRESPSDLAPPTMTNAMLGGLTSNIVTQLFNPMLDQIPDEPFYNTAVAYYTDFTEPTMAFQGEGYTGPVAALNELVSLNDARNTLSSNRPDGVADLGDWVGAGVEGLYAAFGGTPQEQSIHVTGCSAGREEWLCWRPRTTRVVVLISDVAQREGPVGAGEDPLVSTDVSPAPATWAQTVSQFETSRVIPYFAVFTGNVDRSPIDLVAQHRQMAADLGLDQSRHVYVYDDPADLEDVVVPAIGREVAAIVDGM